MDDEDIKSILNIIKGDDSAAGRKAFEALLSQIYDDMYKIAFHICGNRQDAEDSVQNACIKLAQSIHSFDFRSKFSTWLYKVVINAAKDHLRSGKRHLSEDITDKDLPNPCKPDHNAFHKEIFREIDALPENEKTSLILVFVKGLSHAEAAKVLDCKESTVSWYIHEARKKLTPLHNKEDKS